MQELRLVLVVQRLSRSRIDGIGKLFQRMQRICRSSGVTSM
ncbi:MAG: hypothetical protein ACYC7F_01360 [Gemmatimonadaceae bacterium]